MIRSVLVLLCACPAFTLNVSSAIKPVTILKDVVMPFVQPVLNLAPGSKIIETKVAVGSKTQMKLDACRDAITSAYIKTGKPLKSLHLDVVGVKVSSEINEQPYGHIETILGATNRLNNMKKVMPEADYFCSMENGIFDVTTPEGVVQYFDVCWVIIERREDGQSHMAHSTGIQFPTSFVNEARESEGGFVANTVGSRISKAFPNVNGQDPMVFLTKGVIARQEMMTDALRTAAGNFEAAEKVGYELDSELSDSNRLKQQAAITAVDNHVKSGTVIGLGTGSTAYFAVDRVGRLLKQGELTDILAVPTSQRTLEQCKELNIPVTTLDEHDDLDVAIDGADAIDLGLGIIKGGGGAMFREKIVEAAAKKFVVIVDESKLSSNGLGPSFGLPIEVVPFCWEYTARVIEALPAMEGSVAKLRRGSSQNNKDDGPDPAITDNGNYILDMQFDEPIKDIRTAAQQIKNTIGVLEHGFFIDMAHEVVIASSAGTFEVSKDQAPLERWPTDNPDVMR